MLEKTTKRKGFAGRVMAVPLGDGWFAFARALAFPLAEIYNLRSKEMPEVKDLANERVLFRIWLTKQAFTGQRWKQLGVLPLNLGEGSQPWFIKQSPGGTLYRTRDGAEEIPATWDEAALLEAAAVWDPEHVEDRLRDHFSGQPNKWVQSLRPKPISCQA